MKRLAIISLSVSVALNVFLTIVFAIEHHKRQRAEVSAELSAERADHLADAVRAEIARVESPEVALCGIYEFEHREETRRRVEELDLRSDFSCRVNHGVGPGGLKKWKAEKGFVVVDGGDTYRIEGDDLIDLHGRRWLKVR